MLNESTVELAIFERFAALGYQTAQGVALSPEDSSAQRTSWEDVLLAPRVRGRIAALNPNGL